MKRIYKKVNDKKVTIKHVCEVGVHMPKTSNVQDFIKDGIKATLVEPDPGSIQAIKEFFEKYSNWKLYPFAVYDYNGELELAQAGPSTFVASLPSSPALVNDNYKVEEEKKFTVPCKIFSEIDDGTIDLISIDVEGAEWYVLKNMVSKPKIVSIETHGKYYKNPFLDEINNWIVENKYKVWFKDSSDTVYVKEGLLKQSFKETLEIKIVELKLSIKRAKKVFKG